jgi:hypothetical protein
MPATHSEWSATHSGPSRPLWERVEATLDSVGRYPSDFRGHHTHFRCRTPIPPLVDLAEGTRSKARCASAQSSRKPSAKKRAERSRSIFSVFNFVISGPIRPRETVWMWSRLTAHSRGIPSVLERGTSVGMSRIVEVMGATVTSLKNSNAESRVRTTTGRLLFGWGKLYHRISPRLTAHPISALLPTPGILPAREACASSPRGVFAPFPALSNAPKLLAAPRG